MPQKKNALLAMRNPYPSIDFQEAYEWAAKLKDHMDPAVAVDRALLKSMLGLPASSGTSDNIIGSLVHFGLISRPTKSSYSLSDLAIQLHDVHFKSDEWKALALKSINTPELYKYLYERYSADLPVDIEEKIVEEKRSEYRNIGDNVGRVISDYRTSLEFAEVKKLHPLPSTQNLRRIHLDDVKDFVGFALENATTGTMAKILYRDALTSDDLRFYMYSDSIANSFLHPAKIPVDGVHHLLIVIHEQLTADIYINNIPLAANMRPKHDIAKGQDINKSDIADIRELYFPGIEILPTDKIIFCFKVGWRFGLFFDVGPRVWSRAEFTETDEKTLDIERMQHILGGLYRRLLFYDLYKSLESKPFFDNLLKDGWFPFIEIMGLDYDALITAYRENFDIDSKTKRLVGAFTEERLARITNKWWKNPVFNAKQPILNAALQAYAQDNDAGNINCIKNLSTEIEGILRMVYHTDNSDGKNLKSSALVEYIIKRASTSTSEDSLFLPIYFLEYLKRVIFAKFDDGDANPALSRNTSSHGVAKSEKYTRKQALQMILVLDQLYFYSS
jgi:hypothetical protein